MPILSFMHGPGFSFSSAQGRYTGTSIVRLEGPLTLSTLFSFQDEFRAMKPPLLLLDLTACPYMDSAGLGLIMNKFAPNRRLR